MIINGRKFIHVLTVGSYNGYDFTQSDIDNIARYYNPYFREAALWKGHHPSTHVGKDEQPALAWIFPVVAMEDKLYVAFSFMSKELITLIKELQFKYTSVEIMYYQLGDDTVIPYLKGLGLTNRPAVEGLEPLQSLLYEEENDMTLKELPAKAIHGDHTLTSKLEGAKIVKTISFTLENHFINQNSLQMNLTETTKKTLKALNIDPAKFVTEEAAQEAIQKTAQDAQAKVTELEGKVTELTGSTKGKDDKSPEAKKIEALELTLATNLVNDAIDKKKIVPAEKQSYIDMALLDYNKTAGIINGLQERAELTSQQIDTSKTPDLKDPKFIKADGKELTAEDLDKNPSLIAEHKLTLADCEAIYKKAGRDIEK